VVETLFQKKELVMPPSLMEITGLFLLMFITFLANVGGLGGGGVLTPFMLLFLSLSI
jgi:hypothetical protein